VKNASGKTMIGLFAIGAVVLLVGALAVFGSGQFFSKKYQIIMYFDGSVSGLAVGSPVLFRGVPIGEVKEFRVLVDPSQLTFTIPVLVEISPEKIDHVDIGQKSEEGSLLRIRKETPKEFMDTLVARGLRAQLVTQSFVTGQLAIALDLRPDMPARLRGDGAYPEIPTIPSEFEMFAQTVKSLPLKELVSHLIGAVTGIESLVNSPQTAEIPANLNSALVNVDQIMGDLKPKLAGLTQKLNQAVQSYADLAGNLDQRSDKLSVEARKTMESLSSTLGEGKVTLEKFQKVVSPESASVMQINKTLEEIAQAARSLKALTDYLERHPEALIQGKGTGR